MRRWLEEAVRSTSLPLHRRDEGGIRVYDLMQLRGSTCRQLHMLGVNSGILPRPPREDPILGDGLRRKLRESTGRPLPVKTDAGEEERLLLALSLGAATDRVHVSWQRADESGRAKTPSLALREIARIAVGRPDPEALEPFHLPSHPGHALEHLLERPGLLAPSEEMLLAALRGRDRRSVEVLGERYPDLAPGTKMLAATQSFRMLDRTYDARIGPGPEPDHISVSALEKLGCCPLLFFFQYVLHVRERNEPATATEIAPWESGQTVHGLLERLYGRLMSENLFAGDSFDELRVRAHQLFEEERARVLGEFGERVTRRLPVLGRQLVGGWIEAVGSFLDADLERISGNYEPRGLEESRTETVDFGEGIAVRVRGRFDRRLVGDDETIVSDYKTSGDLSDRVNPTQMLKGTALQVPLYAAMAGPDSAVELLGVGPRFEYGADGDYRHPFDGFKKEEIERGFRETMRVLLELRSDGVFPFRSGHHCSWCPYDQACRRNDPPSIDREKASPDSLRYRLLSKKNRYKPILPSEEKTS